MLQKHLYTLVQTPLHLCLHTPCPPLLSPIALHTPRNTYTHTRDEGQGSAFAYLKAQGWATALMAGESGNSFSSVSFFMVRVELTDLGNQHIKEVGEVIFAYITLMKHGAAVPGSNGTNGTSAASGVIGNPTATTTQQQAGGVINDVRFAEYKALQALRFDFRDRSQPMSYASLLAHNMQLYAPGDLLLATYHVPLAYDAGLLGATLDALTPGNVRVLWASKTLVDKATDREAVYQTPFTAGKIPSDWLDAWGSTGVADGGATATIPDLHLPPPNPFVPEDLSLVAAPSAATLASATPGAPLTTSTPSPSLLIDNPPGCRLWHSVDVSFSTPKAVVYVDVVCAEVYVTPEAAVCTRLVVKLLSDYLNELTYPAELAGLYYWVSTSTSGLTLYMTVCGGVRGEGWCWYAHNLFLFYVLFSITHHNHHTDQPRRATVTKCPRCSVLCWMRLQGLWCVLIDSYWSRSNLPRNTETYGRFLGVVCVCVHGDCTSCCIV